MTIWKRVRGVVLFILCSVVISIIAMFAFPDYTERIIPAFFLVVFCRLFIFGILAANRYLMNVESEDRKAKASKEAGARPYKWSAAWTLFGVGSIFVLLGIMALIRVVLHRSINANIAAMLEDGFLGALAIFCGNRVKRSLKNETSRAAGTKGEDELTASKE